MKRRGKAHGEISPEHAHWVADMDQLFGITSAISSWIVLSVDATTSPLIIQDNPSNTTRQIEGIEENFISPSLSAEILSLSTSFIVRQWH